MKPKSFVLQSPEPVLIASNLLVEKIASINLFFKHLEEVLEHVVHVWHFTSIWESLLPGTTLLKPATSRRGHSLMAIGSIWDFCTSIWDHCMSIWDHCMSIWDHFTSIWDCGTSIWDLCTYIWDHCRSIWDCCTFIWDNCMSIRDHFKLIRDHCMSIWDHRTYIT